MQHQVHPDSVLANSQAPHTSSMRSFRGSELAAGLLTRLFRRLPFGLAIRLWNGATVQAGAIDPAGQEPAFTLVFRNPEVVYSAGRWTLKEIFSPLSGSRTIC
jgi:hypothetical protein